MRNAIAVLVAVLALNLAACSKETLTRAELVEWSKKWEPHICYKGSDANYHYFAARPIDYWVEARIRRSEIVIQDERSPDTLGRRIWFYQVDPAQDFAKVPNSEWTGTGRH
jgi:hypothetical protein